MNRTTGAQRANKRYAAIWDAYKQQKTARKDLMPPSGAYGFFLKKAVEKLKITEQEARKQYGQFTFGQWEELLGV